MLGRIGYHLEVATAQVCREGGARVSTNVFVKDMDLATFNALDSRRLEVVADGLTLFGTGPTHHRHNSPPLHRDGTARKRAAYVHTGSRTAQEGTHTPGIGKRTKGRPAWWCWPLKWEGR